MAVWVENSSLPAPGMVSQDLHLSCSDIETCLPIGGQREEVKNQGLELESSFANRTVQQILFEFYTKPTNPKRTMLATAAKPWQQKEKNIDSRTHQEVEEHKERIDLLKEAGDFVGLHANAEEF